MDGVKKFGREDRYVVIKLKKLMDSQRRQLPAMLDKFASACVDAVVVEQDWPEYNFVWLMLEHRMGGYPVPDFNAVKCAADVQAALAREAALREELATAKRNEHNSEVAYKAAIEKQEELREDFDIVSEERDRAGRNASAFEERMGNLQVENGELQQRLTAAEQRNAAYEDLLRTCGMEFSTSEANTWEIMMREKINAALKPTESGASDQTVRDLANDIIDGSLS